MVAQIVEYDTSRGGAHDGANRIYRIWGTEDDNEVRNLVNQTAPLSHGIYRYQGFTFKKLSGDAWEAIVKYGIGQARQRDRPEPGYARLVFSTVGATEKVTIALATTPFPKKVGVKEKTNKFINFDGKKVNGIDLVWPSFTFQVEYTIPGNGMTTAYMYKVFQATGCTNSNAWLGFLSEQVLFLGIDGTIDYGDDTTLTYKFEARFDEELEIAGIQVDKKGWHYAWARTQLTVEDNVPSVTTNQVNVDRVYRTYNFNLLGIPLGNIVSQ